MEPLFRFLCAFVGAMAIIKMLSLMPIIDTNAPSRLSRMRVIGNAQPKTRVTVVDLNEKLWPKYSPKGLEPRSQANNHRHIATCIITGKNGCRGQYREPHPALFLVTMDEKNQQQRQV